MFISFDTSVVSLYTLLDATIRVKVICLLFPSAFAIKALPLSVIVVSLKIAIF